MRIVVLGAVILLAGCVQQGYSPQGPIQLQPYGPAIPYRTSPSYAPSIDPALIPPPVPLDAPSIPPQSQDGGAFPLQDMPAPAADAPSSPTPAPKPQDAPPTPVAQRPPTSGPGSNVPLEGFRPMHSQTRPAP